VPNPAIIQSLVSSGAKGIVFAGTGAGLLSSFEKSALKTILSIPSELRPVMVRSSRVGNGRVIAREEYALEPTARAANVRIRAGSLGNVM